MSEGSDTAQRIAFMEKLRAAKKVARGVKSAQTGTGDTRPATRQEATPETSARQQAAPAPHFHGRFMTLGEFSRLAGVSRMTCWVMAKAGEIPAVWHRRRYELDRTIAPSVLARLRREGRIPQPVEQGADLRGEEILAQDQVADMLGRARSASMNGHRLELHPITLESLCISHERLRALIEKSPQPA